MRDSVFHTLCFRIILLCTSLFVVQFSMTELASRVQQIPCGICLYPVAIFFFHHSAVSSANILRIFVRSPVRSDAILRADSLTIISPLPFFVNTFFEIFFAFFTFVKYVKRNLRKSKPYVKLHKQKELMQINQRKKCCAGRRIVL